MITLNTIKARIKRKKIPELAGSSYIDVEEIRSNIEYFHQYSDEQLLFGIYDSPKKWTVLSVDRLFACYNGKPFYLVLNRDSSQIHQFYGGEKGDKYSDDVILENGKKIWMKSTGLSSSIQNIILMLEKVSHDVIFDKKSKK